jgi:hypothetical protein
MREETKKSEKNGKKQTEEETWKFLSPLERCELEESKLWNTPRKDE